MKLDKISKRKNPHFRILENSVNRSLLFSLTKWLNLWNRFETGLFWLIDFSHNVKAIINYLQLQDFPVLVMTFVMGVSWLAKVPTKVNPESHGLINHGLCNKLAYSVSIAVSYFGVYRGYFSLGISPFPETTIFLLSTKLYACVCTFFHKG